jgi:hypothetical protein
MHRESGDRGLSHDFTSVWFRMIHHLHGIMGFWKGFIPLSMAINTAFAIRSLLLSSGRHCCNDNKDFKTQSAGCAGNFLR